jgi:hypothetical protein
MKSFSFRITVALWLLNGLSLGLYAGGFWLRLAAGTTPGARAGIWTACLAAGLLAGWGLAAATATAGRRWLGLAPAAARWWAALCNLPWLLLAPGLLLYPLCARLGANWHPSLLGQVRLPWQQAFTHLSSADYLLLLWAGPWLTLPIFFTFVTAVKLRLNRLAAGAAGPARPGALVLAAFVFYLLLGAWTTTVYPPTGDEPHYLLITHSVLHEGDLDLADNMRRGDFQAFYPSATLDFHGARARSGALVSKHFPTLSILLAPAYALLGRWGAALLLSLIAALLSALVYRAALEFGASPVQALLAWGLAVISPPLATYFDLIFPELPAAWLLVYGLLSLQRGSLRGAMLGALCAGALTWLYPKYAPLSAVLALAMPFAPRIAWRQAAAAWLVLAALGAAYLFFTRSVYDFGLADNPYGTFHGLFTAHSLKNFLGLLVDRDYGFLATSPVLLLGLAGLGLRVRANTFLAAAAAAVLAVHLALYTVFVDFTGTGSVLSRYLVPGVVLLFPLVPFGWARARAAGRLTGAIALTLAVLGAIYAWLSAACPLLRFLSPKQVLWAKLGAEISIFPSLELHPGLASTLWACGWLALAGWFLVILYNSRNQAAGNHAESTGR